MFFSFLKKKKNQFNLITFFFHLFLQESNASDWFQRDFIPVDVADVPDYGASLREGWNPMRYLVQYLDEEAFQLIADKTNQQHFYSKAKLLNTNAREIKLWFGLTMAMACIQYPIIRVYWQRKWKIPLLADTMARDRYFLLRAHLKLVFDLDITDDARKQDKLWKLRPLLD